jgi:hypothetical protein
MDQFNHEEIKNTVSKIISYYNLEPIPEYSINGKRIDLVVTNPKNNSILMGIEIEITSDLKKDIDNLNTLNTEYKVIISPYADRLKNSLQGILVFNIPSKNNKEFEDFIRKISKGENIEDLNPPYFFETLEINIRTINIKGPELLSEFKKFIIENKLDYYIVRDIIYKAYIGGNIIVGNVLDKPMNYETPPKKEYNFLKALGYFIEDTAYVYGLPIIANLTNDDKIISIAHEIANEIIKERMEDIESIFNKYNKSFVFCSLVGNNYDFSYDLYEHYRFINSTKYQEIIILPSVTQIDINNNSYYWKLHIVCSFVDILDRIKQLYEELERIDIGVSTQTYHGYKGSQEQPLQKATKHIRVPHELWYIIKDYNDLDESLLNEFLSYGIVYTYRNIDLRYNADNFQDLLNKLGIKFELIEKVLSELSQMDITSPLLFKFDKSTDFLSNSKYLFAIYDDNRFNSYVRKRMYDLLKNMGLI